jgi:hypothetical protein
LDFHQNCPPEQKRTGGDTSSPNQMRGNVFFFSVILLALLPAYILQWDALFYLSFVMLIFGVVAVLLKRYVEVIAKNDPNWHLIEGLKRLDERSNM